MSNFSTQLRAHRERLNITQQELAGILDVTYRSVSSWENDRPPHILTQEGAMARLRTKGLKTMNATTAQEAHAKSIKKFGPAYKRLADGKPGKKQKKAKATLI